MRCLVTGATGFVGSWLVRRLVEDGHIVAALTRPTSDHWRIKPWLKSITLVHGSLSTITTLEKEITAFAPELVFHLAWNGGNSSKFNFDAAQVYDNVPGSLELMRIVAASGARVFVNLGSCVQYGSYRIPVCETDPVEPVNIYGAAKYAVELLGQKLAPQFGFRFASIRLFWAYGPGDDDARLIPSIFRTLLAEQRHAMTPGEQLWDFIYIEDVVNALMRIVATPEAEGIFNLGSGNIVSIKEVAQRIGSLLNRKHLIGLGDIPYSRGQVMHLQADTSKLRTLACWEPIVSLTDGLRRTADWYATSNKHLP